MIRLYGVPTCKKIINTKKLLDEKKLDYEFINVKKKPISEIQLRNIVNSLGLEQVLNSKGPTFRKLGLNSTKLSNDELFKVLLQEQGMINRPLIEYKDRFHVGFDQDKIVAFLK